jgi:hypothetical protein
MHDESGVPWTLIADTLAGEQKELSQADRETLERWLADQLSHQRIFATAQQVWETELSWTRPDVAVLKAYVSARIGVDVDGEGRVDQRVRRAREPRLLQIGHRQKGRFFGQSLRQIVSTVFDRLAGSAVVALFGRKVTTLTAMELERLRGLVEYAEPEDE